MMRPWRRRIIGWVSSRVSRNTAVRLTSSTAVPVGVGHAHEQAVLGDAGIVDEDVDAFELGFRLLAERLDLVAVRQIGREQFYAVAEFGGQRLQLLDARAVQADDGALRVQHAGDRLADAAGCAGDERLAAGQIEHVCLLI